MTANTRNEQKNVTSLTFVPRSLHSTSHVCCIDQDQTTENVQPDLEAKLSAIKKCSLYISIEVPIAPNYKGVCLQSTSKPHS